MLGKLLKYDLKWIYKIIVVFYVLAFVFSILGRLLNGIENSVLFSVITQICFGVAIAMMANSLINCMMRLWVRFRNNLYKDESYLTHTIPVEKKTIYASKVIAAILTVITTSIVIVSCLFICYYSEANIETLKSILELAASTYQTTVINIVLLAFLVITLQILFLILIGYVAIILGHKFNTGKMAKTILIGFGLYMLTQMVSLAFIGILGLCSSEVMNLIKTADTISIDAIKMLMYVANGLYLIYILFYYLLGKKAFAKGVNIE